MSRSDLALMLLRGVISHPIALARTYLPSSYAREGLQRWVEDSSLDPEWSDRTATLFSMLPHVSSIIEFGAGKQIVRDLIAHGVSYTACDLVKRNENTLICDLNKELPEKIRQSSYDAAIVSGVMEYVKKPEYALANISNITRCLVLSYAPTDYLNCIVTRRRNGWVNNYSLHEFAEIIAGANFKIENTTRWREQCLFLCLRV